MGRITKVCPHVSAGELRVRIKQAPDAGTARKLLVIMNAMPNKAFKSLDQLEDALCHRLRELEGHPDTVRSMTNFPYLRVTC